MWLEYFQQCKVLKHSNKKIIKLQKLINEVQKKNKAKQSLQLREGLKRFCLNEALVVVSIPAVHLIYSHPRNPRIILFLKTLTIFSCSKE